MEGMIDGGTYTHGVVAISVAVHDAGAWSPCGGRSIKKVGPGEIEGVRGILFLQRTELMVIR